MQALYFRYFRPIWWALYKSRWGSSVRLRWHRLWVRSDEHHSSLDIDIVACLHMHHTGDVQTYFQDLLWRREIAHSRSIPGKPLYYSRLDTGVMFLCKLRNEWVKLPQKATRYRKRNIQPR